MFHATNPNSERPGKLFARKPIRQGALSIGALALMLTMGAPSAFAADTHSIGPIAPHFVQLSTEGTPTEAVTPTVAATAPVAASPTVAATPAATAPVAATATQAVTPTVAATASPAAAGSPTATEVATSPAASPTSSAASPEA